MTAAEEARARAEDASQAVHDAFLAVLAADEEGQTKAIEVAAEKMKEDIDAQIVARYLTYGLPT